MRTRQKTRIEGKSADSQLHSTINKLEFNIDKTEILRDLKVISSHSIPSNFNENESKNSEDGHGEKKAEKRSPNRTRKAAAENKTKNAAKTDDDIVSSGVHLLNPSQYKRNTKSGCSSNNEEEQKERGKIDTTDQFPNQELGAPGNVEVGNIASSPQDQQAQPIAEAITQNNDSIVEGENANINSETRRGQQKPVVEEIDKKYESRKSDFKNNNLHQGKKRSHRDYDDPPIPEQAINGLLLFTRHIWSSTQKRSKKNKSKMGREGNGKLMKGKGGKRIAKGNRDVHKAMMPDSQMERANLMNEQVVQYNQYNHMSDLAQYGKINPLQSNMSLGNANANFQFRKQQQHMSNNIYRFKDSIHYPSKQKTPGLSKDANTIQISDDSSGLPSQYQKPGSQTWGMGNTMGQMSSLSQAQHMNTLGSMGGGMNMNSLNELSQLNQLSTLNINTYNNFFNSPLFGNTPDSNKRELENLIHNLQKTNPVPDVSDAMNHYFLTEYLNQQRTQNVNASHHIQQQSHPGLHNQNQTQINNQNNNNTPISPLSLQQIQSLQQNKSNTNQSLTNNKNMFMFPINASSSPIDNPGNRARPFNRGSTHLAIAYFIYYQKSNKQKEKKRNDPNTDSKSEQNPESQNPATEHQVEETERENGDQNLECEEGMRDSEKVKEKEEAEMEELEKEKRNLKKKEEAKLEESELEKLSNSLPKEIEEQLDEILPMDEKKNMNTEMHGLTKRSGYNNNAMKDLNEIMEEVKASRNPIPLPDSDSNTNQNTGINPPNTNSQNWNNPNSNASGAGCMSGEGEGMKEEVFSEAHNQPMDLDRAVEELTSKESIKNTLPDRTHLTSNIPTTDYNKALDQLK